MIRSVALFLSLSMVGVVVNGQDGMLVINPWNATCTLCEDGQQPVLNPEFAYFSIGEDLKTCPELLEEMNAQLPGLVQNDTACKDLQLHAFQRGCCMFPPFTYCSICPDGSEYDPQAIVPIGTSDNPSCRLLEFRSASLNAFVEPGTCSDTMLRRGSFYCGCQGVEQQCSLCRDETGGIVPGNTATQPNRGDNFLTKSTCEGIEFLFSLFNSEECEDAGSLYGVDLQAFCECPGHSVNDTLSSCSVCPPGQSLGDPDFVWTNPDVDQFQRTCAQAQQFAEYVIQDQVCEVFMAPAREHCECVEADELPDVSDTQSDSSTDESLATADTSMANYNTIVSIKKCMALTIGAFWLIMQ